MLHAQDTGYKLQAAGHKRRLQVTQWLLQATGNKLPRDPERTLKVRIYQKLTAFTSFSFWLCMRSHRAIAQRVTNSTRTKIEGSLQVARILHGSGTKEENTQQVEYTKAKTCHGQAHQNRRGRRYFPEGAFNPPPPLSLATGGTAC